MLSSALGYYHCSLLPRCHFFVFICGELSLNSSFLVVRAVHYYLGSSLSAFLLIGFEVVLGVYNCWCCLSDSGLSLFLLCIRVCHLCVNVAFVLDVVVWSCSLLCVVVFVLISLVLFLDPVVLILLCLRLSFVMCSCVIGFSSVFLCFVV